MTSEDLVVSARALRSGAESLRRVSDDFSVTWSSFVLNVESLGDIFGSDEVGGLIRISYTSAHQIAEETFASAVGALADFAEGLSSMADSHEDNEAEVGALFKSTDGW